MLKTGRVSVMAAGCAAGLLTAFPAFAQAPANAPAAPPPNPLVAAATRSPFAGYKPGDVRVYMSPALRAAMEKVKPQAEAALGRKLVIEMSQAALLQKGIEEGHPFEVALLTKPVMDDVVGKQRVTGQVKLAEVPLGMAARGDLSKVDMKTSAGLKKTMEGARTIRRNYGVGASVPLVDHMVRTLDMDNVIRPKIIAMVGATSPPPPDVPLKTGEYDLMFNMASEIRSTPGWTYIDAIPHELRLPTEFFGGVGPLGDKASAEALMAFLRGPVFRQALLDTGMEPAT